jgi:hypothetical protein
MNWMQVEAYLKRDDRAVLPVGSTEQHAQLSLMVDCILSERVSVDAAEPLGVPVFPPVNYGITPYFRAFPGTISLRLDTFLKVIRDVLDSRRSGLPAHRHRQRPWRQLAGLDPGAGMDDRSSRHQDQIPQLVQRAQDLGQGEADRSRGLPCLLDGELQMDPAAGGSGAEPAEADDRL